MTRAAQLYANTMTERQLQETLRQAFRHHGWLHYHTHDSRRSAAGFPDDIAIRGTRLLVNESKSAKGSLSPAQTEWLSGFMGITRIEVYVWRPSDLDTALEIIGSR